MNTWQLYQIWFSFSITTARLWTFCTIWQERKTAPRIQADSHESWWIIRHENKDLEQFSISLHILKTVYASSWQQDLLSPWVWDENRISQNLRKYLVTSAKTWYSTTSQIFLICLYSNSHHTMCISRCSWAQFFLKKTSIFACVYTSMSSIYEYSRIK